MAALSLAARLGLWRRGALAQGRGRLLVAYLTRSGNTEVIARRLARQFGADLFRIRTAAPYPEDYDAHVDLARRQRDARAMPELAESPERFHRYVTVFLAFPVWGEEIPAPIRTFMVQNDIGTRTLYPCLTHGGYGPGKSLETMAALAPLADIRPSFIQKCDAERDTIDLLRDWSDAVIGPQPAEI